MLDLGCISGAGYMIGEMGFLVRVGGGERSGVGVLILNESVSVVTHKAKESGPRSK
jgi:hypothetical protein